MSKFVYDLIAKNSIDFHSDAVDVLAFDRQNDVVYVKFTSGGEYTYEGVAESTYAMWVDADSQGRFYYGFIQGDYDRSDDPDGIEKRAVQAPADTSAPDLKPTQKWAGQAPAATIAASKYVVEWKTEQGVLAVFGGKPEFQALSEADALVQFNTEMAATQKILGDFDVKIVSVTHYL